MEAENARKENKGGRGVGDTEIHRYTMCLLQIICSVTCVIRFKFDQRTEARGKSTFNLSQTAEGARSLDEAVRADKCDLLV